MIFRHVILSSVYSVYVQGKLILRTTNLNRKTELCVIGIFVQ